MEGVLRVSAIFKNFPESRQTFTVICIWKLCRSLEILNMEKDQSESAKINFDVSFDVDVTLVCDD